MTSPSWTGRSTGSREAWVSSSSVTRWSTISSVTPVLGRSTRIESRSGSATTGITLTVAVKRAGLPRSNSMTSTRGRSIGSTPLSLIARLTTSGTRASITSSRIAGWPSRASMTALGALPGRKPWILTFWESLAIVFSNARSTSSAGTSIVRATWLPGSVSREITNWLVSAEGTVGF